MDDLISIIIPVYNVKDYLDRCMKSVLEQTYSNIEVILIDDGSVDGSEYICDKYVELDTRIVLIHKENGGLSDARNTGIGTAKGKYIFFLDSDDWISAECIELLYLNLKNNNLDISVGGIAKSYNNGIVKRYTEKGNKIYNSAEASFDIGTRLKICTMAWNKLYRIELFRDCVYPANRINEDEFVTYKLILKANRIGYVDNITYFYYQRNISIMSSDKCYVKLDALEAFDERIKIYSNLKYLNCIEATEYTRLMYLYNAASCEKLDIEIKKELHKLSKEKEYYKYRYKYLGISKCAKALLRVIAIKRKYKKIGKQ